MGFWLLWSTIIWYMMETPPNPLSMDTLMEGSNW